MSDQERIDEYLKLNPVPQYLKHCKGKGSEWKKGQSNRKEQAKDEESIRAFLKVRAKKGAKA